MRKEVTFWLPALNPYWLQRIDFLTKCSPDIRVKLVINRRKDLKRDWEFELPKNLDVLLVGLNLNPISWIRYYKAVIASRRNIIITFHYRFFCLPIIFVSKFLDSPLVYYLEDSTCNGTNKISSNSKSDKARKFAKKLAFKFPSFVLVPGSGSASYATTCVDSTKVLLLPHVVFNNYPYINKNIEITGGESNNPLRALFVGHLTLDKGFDLVLELIEATQEFLIWNICGDGALKSDLLTLISKLPDNRVRYHGFLQQSELVHIYKNSSFLIFPTRHDTYALVVDEAMSHGVIPITSNRIGDIDWRLKGRGILVSEYSYKSWLREISCLAVNKARIRALSENCHNFMVERDGEFWLRHINQLLTKFTDAK